MQFEAVACRLFLHYSYTLAQKASNYGIFCFYNSKKDLPQKVVLREMMGTYLKESNVKVKDGTDVNSIMRDMMSIIPEGTQDEELNEELG